MNVNRFRLAFLSVSLALGGWSPELAGQDPDQQPAGLQFEVVRPAMGVELKITVWCADRELATAGMTRAIRRVEQLEQVLSHYRDDSEVVRVGSALANGPVVVSDDLWRVLKHSESFWTSSDGIFDVTLGPLIELWRQTVRTRSLPTPEAIADARQQAGFQHLRLDEKNRTISSAGMAMQFDFGGIGKGYAADQALAVLRASGIPVALVDLGGDIAVGDAPPGQAGWRVAIEKIDTDEPPEYYFEAANCGVATSGDKHQFVEIDGIRYSHILNPATGLGLQRSSLLTVVASDATQADGYASVCTLLDWRSAEALANGTDQVELLGVAMIGHGAGSGRQSVRSRAFPELKLIESNP